MTMRPLSFAFSLILTGLSALVFATQTDAAPDAGPFLQGSVRMSIMLGSGTAFRRDYTILGGGLGFYITDGVEGGVDVEFWQGNDPRIVRLSPQLLYVHHQLAGNAKPYAGVFYRRVIIDQQGDLNDAGARAGFLFLYGRKAYLGVGFVYDAHLNCDRIVWDSCADAYPELRLAIMF